MALTGQNKRVYEGDHITLADIRQLVTDTADYPADSPVHVNLLPPSGQVQIVVEQASV